MDCALRYLFIKWSFWIKSFRTLLESVQLFHFGHVRGSFFLFFMHKFTLNFLLFHITTIFMIFERFLIISISLLTYLALMAETFKVFQLVIDVLKQFSCTVSMLFFIFQSKDSNIDQKSFDLIANVTRIKFFQKINCRNSNISCKFLFSVCKLFDWGTMREEVLPTKNVNNDQSCRVNVALDWVSASFNVGVRKKGSADVFCKAKVSSIILDSAATKIGDFYFESF